MFEGHDQTVFDLLAERRLVDLAQLELAQAEHWSTGKAFATVLLDLGLIDKPALLHAVAEHLGAVYADGIPSSLPSAALALVDGNLARSYGVAPLHVDARSVALLAVDPFNAQLTYDLTFVLDRQARFLEKSQQLRGKVKAAMVYPIVVMTVALAILVGLLVFVVPQFKKIFADLLKGAPLPSLTQAVLSASDFVRAHYPVVVAGLAVAWFVFRFFRRSPGGSKFIDGLLVRLPLFGDLIMKSLVARFTRTLGTLLSSGVAILPSLLIARDTCGNARVAGAIGFVHERVKAGEPVARTLESTQVLPPMVTSMIDVGEHTGQLPAMLGKIADLYDDEVDNAVAGLSSLIEPVLILMLAGIVGTIVIALFLPIVRIVQLLT